MSASRASVFRRLALQSESALQAGLRAGAAGWARVGRRGHPSEPTDFRGRQCHCPAGLPLHFVHSEALREMADFVVDFGSNVRGRGRPGTPVPLLQTAVTKLAPGAVVHVKADLLDPFATILLPLLRERIVLVTGDSDVSPVRRHAALLDHPMIAHWFAQNVDDPRVHPRLTRLPIGLDNPVYTKLEKRLGFLVTMLLRRTPLDLTVSRNDIGDQAGLNRVRAVLPPPSLRPSRVLCTFHQNQKIIRPDVSTVPDRAEAYRLLRDRPECEFIPRRLRQVECWRRHGEFAFEVSPRGNGLDCFRTWEALALGTIPIVKTSPLDVLYRAENLPVVIVDAWEEINRPNLERWRTQWQGHFGPELDRRLSADYWTSRIRNESQRVRVG